MTHPGYTPEGHDARSRAHRRVRAKRKLATSFVTYLVVNAFFIVIWAMGDGGSFWPAWILAGWGLGLALNAWNVLWRRPVTDADIDREMRRGQPSD